MLNRYTLTGLAALFLSSSALAAPPLRGSDSRPIEPVKLPPSIQQGVDMIYVDPEITRDVQQRDSLLEKLGVKDEPGAPTDLFRPMSQAYTGLRRALNQYRSTWAQLPQVKVTAGAPMKIGAKGERVALIRQRLGLPAGNVYDEALATAVRRYQQVHGIKADGVAGESTLVSLNLGADHYLRVLMINLDRARTLPASDAEGRYILVDAGAAQLYMFEGGKIRDSMKVIVGKAASATPMMASLLRYASVNPYWNVPVDLVQTLVAPKVLAEGTRHIEAQRYQVLSDWTDEAEEVDPASVDWPGVAKGSVELRVRQLPGRDNSMGAIKFMMPNDYGIYLHDTNEKGLFANTDRWISNGCVRVEDARRLAKWLFARVPEGKDPNAEEDVALDRPVPVYITYLTAEATADGSLFRKDPYGRDAALLERYARAAEAAIRTS